MRTGGMCQCMHAKAALHLDLWGCVAARSEAHAPTGPSSTPCLRGDDTSRKWCCKGGACSAALSGDRSVHSSSLPSATSGGLGTACMPHCCCCRCCCATRVRTAATRGGRGPRGEAASAAACTGVTAAPKRTTGCAIGSWWAAAGMPPGGADAGRRAVGRCGWTGGCTGTPSTGTGIGASMGAACMAQQGHCIAVPATYAA